MVLLTMTPAITVALKKVHIQADSRRQGHQTEAPTAIHSDLSLLEPSEGKPISHCQVIELSRQLRSKGISPHHLDVLLRGSKVYIPSPPPRPEPTPEYKALMARLRREEEARAYERMTNPLPPMETFSQRFPATSAANAFSSTSSYPSLNQNNDSGDDNLTYADVNRQVALIFNVLISIFACAAALWTAARWWDTPARLALAMSGSLLVGVAEVVVYSGYIRRVGESKVKEARIKEVKEIVNTWFVGGESEDVAMLPEKEDTANSKVRKRK